MYLPDVILLIISENKNHLERSNNVLTLLQFR